MKIPPALAVLILGLLIQFPARGADRFTADPELQHTDARQLVSDLDDCVLKADGSIWQFHASGDEPQGHRGWEMIALGPVNKAISAGFGRLYTQRDSGEILARYHHDSWIGIAGWVNLGKRAPGTQMVVGPVMLYTLEPGSGIFKCTIQGQWTKIGDATDVRMIALDRDKNFRAGSAEKATIYSLKNNGNIHQYSGTSEEWTMIDDGTGSIFIDSANDYLYVLKDDGTMWRRVATVWKRVHEGSETRNTPGEDGADAVRSIRASGLFADLYLAKENGDLWILQGKAARRAGVPAPGGPLAEWLRPATPDAKTIFADEKWSFLGNLPHLKQMATSASGKLRLLLENGDIYSQTVVVPPSPSPAASPKPGSLR